MDFYGSNTNPLYANTMYILRLSSGGSMGSMITLDLNTLSETSVNLNLPGNTVRTSTSSLLTYCYFLANYPGSFTWKSLERNYITSGGNRHILLYSSATASLSSWINQRCFFTLPNIFSTPQQVITVVGDAAN